MTISFSIIIPLFNKEHYIKQTLLSVISQTYQYFEVIVVNDGSTDSSVSQVESVLDSRIILYSIVNSGVSIARNYGVSKAKNDYVCFLDGDDIWIETHLEQLVYLIDKNPKHCIFSTAYILNKKDCQTEMSFSNTEYSIIDNYCAISVEKGWTPCWTSATCMTRNLYMQLGGFKKNIKLGEDVDLWLRAACITNVVVGSKPTAIYNIESENNSDVFTSIKVAFPFWEWYNYQYNDRYSLYLYTSRKIFNLAVSAYKQHDILAFFYLLFKIKKKHDLLIFYIKKYLSKLL